MKKGLLFIMVALTLPFLSNAQNWLTLKGGGGLGTFSSDLVSKSGLLINSGLGYKQQISKRMIVEGDILFDTRSNEIFTGEADADGNSIYFPTSATYVQIPITLHCNWLLEREELIPYRMRDSKSHFYVEGGPYFAYGLSVTHFPNPNTVLAYANSEDPIKESDLTPGNIDVGVTGGFGFSFGFENMNKLNIGARANYGFLDLYKDARLGSATNLGLLGYVAFDFSLTDRQHIRHRW